MRRCGRQFQTVRTVTVFVGSCILAGSSLGEQPIAERHAGFDDGTVAQPNTRDRLNTPVDDGNAFGEVRGVPTIAIAFQGRFFDANDLPLTGLRDLTFEIFDNPINPPIFSTTVNGVVLNKGVATTQIPGVPVNLFDGYSPGDPPYRLRVLLSPENSDFFVDILLTPLAATAVNADTVDGFHAGNAAGQVAVSNGVLCDDLNADLLDGKEGAFYRNASNINSGTLGAARIEPNIVSSINGVVNDGGNISLVAGSNITVTQSQAANSITIGTTGIITAVQAGNGLTGGGSSGAVTLTVGAGTAITVGATTVGVTAGGIGTTQLANNAVNSSKLALDGNSLPKVSANIISVSGTTISIAGAPSLGMKPPSLLLNGIDNQLTFAHTGSNHATSRASIVYNTANNDIPNEGVLTFQRRSTNNVPERIVMAMRLVDGHVGIGTLTPGSALTVIGDICATGIIGVCSDARLKREIRDIPNALDKLLNMEGVYFKWRRDEFPGRAFSEKRQVGFVAQDVAMFLPEAVSKGTDGYYSVDYGRIVPLLVEGVKQLNQTVVMKENRIASLQADLQDVSRRLAAMEQLVASLAAEQSGEVR